MKNQISKSKESILKEMSMPLSSKITPPKSFLKKEENGSVNKENKGLTRFSCRNGLCYGDSFKIQN